MSPKISTDPITVLNAEIRPSGLTRPALLGVAMRLIDGVAGLVTLAFVARQLSPSVQGYYFTFINLSQLTQLADLGLAVLLVQFVSHEARHFAVAKRGAIDGTGECVSRLRCLGRFALTWYGAFS